MPTFRSITVSLISQFDILSIPEYAPLQADLSVQAYGTDGITNSAEFDAQSIISVYVPTAPGERFWLQYSIAPPQLPKSLYYFKLLINGVEIVSWGVGKKNRWQGKTMFALCKTDQGHREELEQRLFCFARSGDQPGSDGEERRTHGRPPHGIEKGDLLEIRVYRARGRIRVDAEMAFDTKPFVERASIKLVNAGLLPIDQPRRFYKYALVDPVDQPFAVFCFHLRTMRKPEAMDITSQNSSPILSAADVTSEQRHLLPKKIASRPDIRCLSLLQQSSPLSLSNLLSKVNLSTVSLSTSSSPDHTNTVAIASLIKEDDSKEEKDLSPLKLNRAHQKSSLSLEPPPATRDQFAALVRASLAHKSIQHECLATSHLETEDSDKASVRQGDTARLRRILDHAVARCGTTLQYSSTRQDQG